MQLMIDGTAVQAQAGESLREIIIQNHMDTDELQTRPLAAKIAGEVFTLNYIPVRASDSTPESASVRRAMAASKGEIHLLRYSDGSGKKVYTRTACFLVFLAIRKRWPGGHHNLDIIAARCGYDLKNHHHALADAEACAAIALEIL